MRNLQIPDVMFVVIGVHVLIQLIICTKPIFIKNENLYHFKGQSETENSNTYNEGMYPMISKLMDIKKTNLYSHYF